MSSTSSARRSAWQAFCSTCGARLILSFVAFWLAYKSKELAVMLPLRARRLRILVRQTALEAARSRSSRSRSRSDCRACCSIPTGTTITLSTSAPARFSRPPASTRRDILLVPFAGLALPLILLLHPRPARLVRNGGHVAVLRAAAFPGRPHLRRLLLPAVDRPRHRVRRARRDRAAQTGHRVSSCSGFPGTNSTCG